MSFMKYEVQLFDIGSAHCVYGLIKILLITNIPQPQMVFLFTDGHVAQEGIRMYITPCYLVFDSMH